MPHFFLRFFASAVLFFAAALDAFVALASAEVREFSNLWPRMMSVTAIFR